MVWLAYSGRTASSAPWAAASRMYLHAVAWFSSMASSWDLVSMADTSVIDCAFEQVRPTLICHCMIATRRVGAIVRIDTVNDSLMRLQD